jgi:hypothetical protein
MQACQHLAFKNRVCLHTEKSLSSLKIFGKRKMRLQNFIQKDWLRNKQQLPGQIEYGPRSQRHSIPRDLTEL